MKIMFHTNQLSLRGTEIAVFDYAHYNEELLNNSSIIAVKRSAANHPLVAEKFKKRFQVIYYDTLEQLEKFAQNQHIDIFYTIKAGPNDGILLKGVKNCVHAVFRWYEPHGDVYAYISKWLSNEMSGGKVPFVPHMVHLPKSDDNFRTELNIPSNAIVFGRYGGWETFDIAFVKRLVYFMASSRKDLYFLFMNTEDFLATRTYYEDGILNSFMSPIIFEQKKLNNIIFLEGTADLKAKAKFINTCDAMLHARLQGESFGIACGEFSILNKPVITCNASSIKERCHLEILGNKGIYYATYNELYEIINNFKKDDASSWDAYSKDYNPKTVMEKFKAVFIDNN